MLGAQGLSAAARPWDGSKVQPDEQTHGLAIPKQYIVKQI